MIENGVTKLWVIGHQVTPITVGGRVAAVDVVLSPGVPGPPPHLHPGAAEYFYVIEGSLEIMAGEEWTEVSAGEYFVVPGDVVHTFRMEGSERARFITGWDPSGFEQFFFEAGVPAEEPGAFERSVSDEQIAVAVESLSRLAEVPALPAPTG